MTTIVNEEISLEGKFLERGEGRRSVHANHSAVRACRRASFITSGPDSPGAIFECKCISAAIGDVGASAALGRSSLTNGPKSVGRARSRDR